MARSNAQAWWVDVEDFRERVEARRAAEATLARASQGGGRRTVSITGHPPALTLLSDSDDPLPTSTAARRRPPRGVTDRLGTRPDRIAAWAVLLGFAIVLGTILTAHL